jgi:uncharacterized membrane protein
MIDGATLLTILAMAAATYSTRALGYAVLRGRTLGRRARVMMEAAPPCVLISVIAPVFATRDPADLLALAITLAAATRLPMLPVVLIGIAAAGLLRQVLG